MQSIAERLPMCSKILETIVISPVLLTEIIFETLSLRRSVDVFYQPLLRYSTFHTHDDRENMIRIQV